MKKNKIKTKHSEWDSSGAYTWSFAYLGGLKGYCKCPPVLRGRGQGKREEKEKEAQVQKG